MNLIVAEDLGKVTADEAMRVLRPGGELVFLGNSSLLMLCAEDDETVPAGNAMLRDHFVFSSLRGCDGASLLWNLRPTV